MSTRPFSFSFFNPISKKNQIWLLFEVDFEFPVIKKEKSTPRIIKQLLYNNTLYKYGKTSNSIYSPGQQLREV